MFGRGGRDEFQCVQPSPSGEDIPKVRSGGRALEQGKAVLAETNSDINFLLGCEGVEQSLETGEILGRGRRGHGEVQPVLDTSDGSEG